jgi:hypothetical protein
MARVYWRNSNIRLLVCNALLTRASPWHGYVQEFRRFFAVRPLTDCHDSSFHLFPGNWEATVCLCYLVLICRQHCPWSRRARAIANPAVRYGNVSTPGHSYLDFVGGGNTLTGCAVHHYSHQSVEDDQRWCKQRKTHGWAQSKILSQRKVKQ